MRILLIFLVLIIAGCESQQDENNYGTFSFDIEVKLKGTPIEIFDMATGDISGWWDHSFSENPDSLYIEPFPGGGFYEIFDSEGNGVKHADVIAAERGKLLRLDGALGLAGNAIQMVHTYTFDPIGTDSTKLKILVDAAGKINDKWPEIVKGVWHHFIFEQFKKYTEK